MDGRKTGALLTLGLHIALILALLLSGLHDTAPRPEEGITFSFEPEFGAPQPVIAAVKAPTPAAPAITRKPALAKPAPSRTTTSGDVEVPEPPTEEPLNKKAIFPGGKDKKSGETSGAKGPEPAVGSPTGVAGSDGKSFVNVAGRSIEGDLPLPDYTVNASGKVVVRIVVGPSGTVTSATAGVPGTTVQNKVLWDAARRAALQARFNHCESVNEGTITYIFNLK